MINKETNNDELKEINMQLAVIYNKLFEIDKNTDDARVAIIRAYHQVYGLIS